MLTPSVVDGWQGNQTWTAEIMYVYTGEGWFYLAAMMDLAGRRIVGRSMSATIDATLVCAAIKSAWSQLNQSKNSAGCLGGQDSMGVNSILGVRGSGVGLIWQLLVFRLAQPLPTRKWSDGAGVHQPTMSLKP